MPKNTTYTIFFSEIVTYLGDMHRRLDAVVADNDLELLAQARGEVREKVNRDRRDMTAETTNELLEYSHVIEGDYPTDEEVEEYMGSVEMVEIGGLALVHTLPEGMTDTDPRVVWKSCEAGHLHDEYMYAIAA